MSVSSIFLPQLPQQRLLTNTSVLIGLATAIAIHALQGGNGGNGGIGSKMLPLLTFALTPLPPKAPEASHTPMFSDRLR